ncbi:AAA family ATPase [Streptomyces litchfieldiae]|uniref:AAA family ATPase n=1 Tax=Streptomyces litchfieldiae TaxID=3075543 RepID=A0ABU2MQH7_9ACTN|nr:AAA family ATPase [Streptomyces sp. DSM 44938]MDT0343878.1 AAA family ATPase [Streptomyces sp. DSM 44938]
MTSLAEVAEVGPILPYSLLVGHQELRTALEIAYVNEAVGGVLATGQRGTAKTTTVRAFTMMTVGELPVTLPIGATDDRVLGGWQIKKLMQGAAEPEDGLLVEAARSAARMLYVDEINLLDDYLVNIILDVVSTGILSVQREGRVQRPQRVDFTLVGTMNPDEGGLRPQLLDRFGLVATVQPEEDAAQRQRVVETVLRFEAERDDPDSEFLAEARRRDAERKRALDAARERLGAVRYGPGTAAACARLAAAFRLVGHRGDLVLGRASRALAAIDGEPEVTERHVRRVARMVLVHRRAPGDSGTLPEWTAEDDARVAEQLPHSGAE